MLYSYKVTTKEGRIEEGSIDTNSQDTAITTLQSRGFTIISIEEAINRTNLFSNIRFTTRVSNRDMVIVSRQLATLFEAKVSVLSIFKLLAAESESANLRDVLSELVDDIQTGMTISNSMAKHPNAFSPFYVNMVRAGEEAGKLSESFSYLADYLERNYEITTKVRSALAYPAFVILSFIGVMVVMLTVVIPKLSTILTDTGQELPFYTKIVLGLSAALLDYGIFILILLVILGFVAWQYGKTPAGRYAFSQAKLATPYVGSLYRKLYLSRISDNMDTMLSSGISMLRALEISASVVDSEVYKDILLQSMEMVKAGYPLSNAFSRFSQMPAIVVQMTRIGEETGKLGYVLKTIARFYKREVDSAIDGIVSLIEPVMIVTLGLGVGFLLVSVLGPIYSVTSGI
ncbi:MAG: type II secretion system F family protein [Patescibacteria group bacterium]